MSHSLKRSLVDIALEQMRQRIDTGVWVVDQRLPPEPALSAELGISRNTIREAVRVLTFAGLLEVRQGDGTYVRACADPLDAMKVLSRCSLEHARETRMTIEVEASRLAALRRTEADLLGLRAALADAEAHLHGDLESYIERDLLFHCRLVDAAHNPALSELYRYFSRLLAATLRQTLSEAAPSPSLLALHHELLAAVAQGDAESAACISRRLINHA